MSIRVGPCPGGWPLVGCGTNGAMNCTEFDSLDPVTQSAVEDTAIGYLWNWSGRRFGLCPTTIRPCRETCFDWDTTYRGHGRGNAYPGLPWYGDGALSPALIGGEWFNLPCGGSCTGTCECGPVEQVDLGGGIDSVSQVLINGEILSPLAYRVDNHRYLVRTDGGRWPDCQDMSADPAELGTDTFAVTYLSGVPVPAGGQLAAGALACELAKAMCGSTSCKLPQRVQTIARQSVTIAFDDMATMWTRGATGIFVVDSWLASVNVSKRGGRVASPDHRGVRRTTSP